MSKSSLNFVVDSVAFAAFVLLAVTGFLVRYVLPPGSGHFNTLWAMDRHEWGQVHFWIAMVLLGTLAIHLFLHWRWVVCIVRGPRERSTVRIALATVAGLALLGLGIAPFFGQVELTGEAAHKTRSGQHRSSTASPIDGSMTLRDVELRTGVPADVVLQELGLPPGLSTDERLGQLRRQHGFKMHDVREIVQNHPDRR